MSAPCLRLLCSSATCSGDNFFLLLRLHLEGQNRGWWAETATTEKDIIRTSDGGAYVHFLFQNQSKLYASFGERPLETQVMLCAGDLLHSYN